MRLICALMLFISASIFITLAIANGGDWSFLMIPGVILGFYSGVMLAGD